MAYLAWAIAFCAGIGGAVYLVLQGYPWFAVFVLLVTSSIQVKSNKED